MLLSLKGGYSSIVLECYIELGQKKICADVSTLLKKKIHLKHGLLFLDNVKLFKRGVQRNRNVDYCQKEALLENVSQ